MMKRKYPRTPWCKAALKALIDQDMSKIELAEAVGMSRNLVADVVNGRVFAPEIAEKITAVLHITVPYTHPLK